MIFGFLGWLLDGRLGTRPVFMLVFFLFTLGYVVWKMFVRYDAEMRRHEASSPGRELERRHDAPMNAVPVTPAVRRRVETELAFDMVEARGARRRRRRRRRCRRLAASTAPGRRSSPS